MFVSFVIFLLGREILVLGTPTLEFLTVWCLASCLALWHHGKTPTGGRVKPPADSLNQLSAEILQGALSPLLRLSPACHSGACTVHTSHIVTHKTKEAVKSLGGVSSHTPPHVSADTCEAPNFLHAHSLLQSCRVATLPASLSHSWCLTRAMQSSALEMLAGIEGISTGCWWLQRLYLPAEPQTSFASSLFMCGSFCSGSPITVQSRYVVFMHKPEWAVTSELKAYMQVDPDKGKSPMTSFRWGFPFSARFLEVSDAVKWSKCQGVVAIVEWLGELG